MMSVRRGVHVSWPLWNLVAAGHRPRTLDGRRGPLSSQQDAPRQAILAVVYGPASVRLNPCATVAVLPVLRQTFPQLLIKLWKIARFRRPFWRDSPENRRSASEHVS